MKRFQLMMLTAAFALSLAACEKEAPVTEAPAVVQPAPAPDLRSLLAGPGRSDADKALDAGRKPVEVIEFLGIEPGMRVIDIIAAGGWYTEVLSFAVGPTGQVVSQNPDVVLQMREGVNEIAITARLADNRLPNVTRMNKNFDAIVASDGPFDAGITSLNFHDIYNGNGADAAVTALKTIASILKPGAAFGVIDHVGIAGADNAALHRIEIEKAIETAQAAGFIVEAQSDLLHVEADDHAQNVFAEGLRGNTDRFILKLRKPAE